MIEEIEELKMRLFMGKNAYSEKYIECEKWKMEFTKLQSTQQNTHQQKSSQVRLS